MEDKIEIQILDEEHENDFELKDDEVYIIVDKDEYQIIVDSLYDFYVLDKNLGIILCTIDCNISSDLISSTIIYSEELKNMILNYDYNKVNKFLYDNKDEILEVLSSIINKMNEFDLDSMIQEIDEDEDDE